MKVGNGLAAIPAVVDDEAIACFGDPATPGHFRGSHHEVAEEGRIVRAGFADSGDGTLRDQDDMDGGLGLDVPEGEQEVVLENNVCGDVACDDALEQGHGRN